DDLQNFIQGGYWEFMCSDTAMSGLPHVALRNQMKCGDRIAIKKMLGYGATKMHILALGILRGTPDPHTGRVGVNWKIDGLARPVPLGGCVPAINGPY